jgi:NodT family efflux transporter outer membrane factor (OMF) lipoprotein
MERMEVTRIVCLINLVLFLIASFTLGGCAVGPDFRAPAPPGTKSYTKRPVATETASATGAGGASQRFVQGEEIPEQWWTLFRSPPLDKLVRQALAESPTLSAAQARLREAEENLRARTGAIYYPGLDANFSAARQKISGASSGQPAGGGAFDLYNASVRVTYLFDLFGGGRRELESLASRVEYHNFQLEGAYLTLTSNIVTTAVHEASLRAEIREVRDIVALEGKYLALTEQQFNLGGVSRSILLAQRAQLAQTEATLPPLEKQLALTRHRLALYAGGLPSEADLPEFTLESLHLPEELPVSVPSSLVRQRPDIRAAEGLLHAASAQVGVATANLYPQINLTGSLGSNSTRIQDLFSSGTSLWSLGAGILQPLFHGGELTARRRAAVAAYDQAAAQYRETVLQAFQNVADALRSIDQDALTLKAQSAAEVAAREALDLIQAQLQLGAVNYLLLLDAQRLYLLARIKLEQSRAARFADTAVLFQALGGGWWNRTSMSTAEAVAELRGK